MAFLIPFDEGSLNRSFRDRQTLPDFDALPEVSGDAAVSISEDRDREILGAILRQAVYLSCKLDNNQVMFKANLTDIKTHLSAISIAWRKVKLS